MNPHFLTLLVGSRSSTVSAFQEKEYFHGLLAKRHGYLHAFRSIYHCCNNGLAEITSMRKTILVILLFFISSNVSAWWGYANNDDGLGNKYTTNIAACNVSLPRLQEQNPTYIDWVLSFPISHTFCTWTVTRSNVGDQIPVNQIIFYVEFSDCPSPGGWDQEIQQCILIPVAKENKNTGGQDQCTSPDIFYANPINIGTGNKYQREVDYRASGAFPLGVSRSYNSKTESWRFFPEAREIIAGMQVDLIRADSKRLTFSNNSGNWVSDPDVLGTLSVTYGVYGDITSWIYTTANDQVETYDSEGRLLSVTDRSGLSHSYVYQADSIIISHTSGATLVYQLNTEGQVIGFTDPDNNIYQYSYDTEGRLTEIIFPDSTPANTTDNPSRIYHYENSLFPNALTGITDENGDRYATWAYDSQGRAISSEHSGGVDMANIDYTYLQDAADPRVTVTNALGKQTTYHITTIHDVFKVVSVEGHPTASCEGANKAYSYNANGFLESKTDWNGNTTTYLRDARGLELSRTEASGAPEARTITTEWHPDFRLPTKITEPGRIIEYTYDAQGRRLSSNVGSVQ